MCRSAHCGEHKSSTRKSVMNITKVALNNLNCSGRETELWGCIHPGWYVSDYIKGHVMNIECSGKAALLLINSDNNNNLDLYSIFQETQGRFSNITLKRNSHHYLIKCIVSSKQKSNLFI